MIDSTRTDSSGHFNFQLIKPVTVGIYRLVFVDDRFVEIIAGSESVELLLDFESDPLTENLLISKSLETKIYYDVLEIESRNSIRIAQLSQLLRLYQKKSLNPSFQSALSSEISRLDVSRRQNLEKEVRRIPNSFVQRWLYACYTPLPQFTHQWKQIYPTEREFQIDHFLDHVNFADDQLLYSSYYRIKLEYYLQMILPDDPTGQNYGIDLILQKSRINRRVHDYVVTFLCHYYTINDQKFLADHVRGYYPKSE
ncbi:hypothetical protein GF406_22160 [candidate division KSB1 bacterium]|nr:hypothetical protein [candidate division KSB1 bacterium]